MGYTKIIKSGTLIEIYEYENDINYQAIEKAHRAKRRPRYKKPTYIRPDTARRRAKAFLRLVRSNIRSEERPALLTLTMYDVCSLRDGWRAYRAFNQRLRRNEGKSYRYIAVPEFQRRGAVHYHVLIWGLNEEQIKRESELRYFQGLWQRGFVDCILTDGSPKLAGYLAKYMSKALSDERLCGEKAYMASRNVMRPLQLPFKISLEHTEAAFGINLEKDEPIIDKIFEVKWLGKARYRLFNEKDMETKPIQ